ncbi:deoxycytidylate deaminase [Bombus pascuorum]|uniref:deoxycytidylate deaminase n=1 Tax=Bombus pascuorum TaxID=65598 RepID=UPI00212DA5CB|nr:deoxycytidylate deaminase [Bombus pascuorum]
MTSKDNIEVNEKVNSESEQPRSDKRKNYIDWEDYFMALAFLSAKRSKDPRTQVGACIVNEEKQVISIGYNGMPNGCSDDVFPWSKESVDPLETKNLYVCHAEVNAILNKGSKDVKNCTIYISLFPCNECAKVIIQSGIRTVKYVSDKYAKKKKIQAAKRMFDAAGITYSKYVPKHKKLIIDFGEIDSTEDKEINIENGTS